MPFSTFTRAGRAPSGLEVGDCASVNHLCGGRNCGEVWLKCGSPADPREPQINVSLMSPKTPERLHARLEKFREKISERLIMAPSRHYGGPVAAGQVYRIHDQEYFAPLQPGTIYNQQQINNSKAAEVHYHFNNTFNLPKLADSYNTKKSGRQIAEQIAAYMRQQLK